VGYGVSKLSPNVSKQVSASKLPQLVWKNVWLRAVSCLVIGCLLFFLGLGIGNGTIQIGFFSDTQSENQGLPSQLNYASINQVYDALKQNYNGKLTSTELLNGLKEGLAQATGDPYTEYFSPSDAKQFSDELNNSFSGIGVELDKDANGNLIIISPITGFPAAKAGLQAQDIITSINGQDTSNLTLDTAADDIRGPQGSKVTLGILRDQTQTLSFTITRQNIQLPSVTSKILSGNIGYIQISTFADDTSKLAKQVAQQFEQAKVKGIILDLRDNPGGLVDAAVNVSSLWLPSGDTVVQEKGTVGNVTYTATGGNVLNGIPTVVLINGGSASASEITAGALHDNKAAWLVGTKSFGKGVVQQLVNFPDGSELKVTVASWYRPDGQNINHKGITPDQVVNPSTSTTSTDDTQLQAAESYLAAHE
jgi:carboxyl-terminal processing protease